jgi:hypothetical protein
MSSPRDPQDAPSPYREADPPNVRLRQLAPFRFTAAFAGVLLACTFFMPALKGCDEVLVPSHELVKEIAHHDGSFRLRDLVFTLDVYAAPYLFGALAAAAALARQFRVRGATTFAWAASATAAIVFTSAMIAAAGTAFGSIWNLVIMAIGVYFGSSLRLRGHAHFRATMVASGVAALWFGFWSAVGEPYYGVRLSCAGATLLFVAAVGEGRGSLGRRLFW